MGDVLVNSPNRHNIRESFEKKSQERKRNLLYLIKGYLVENGLGKTAESLQKEAGLSGDVEVCDNIDLDTILQEYSSFYYAKFSKFPKICKKVEAQKAPRGTRRFAPVPKPASPPKEKEDFEIAIKQISNVKTPEKDAEGAVQDFEPSCQDKDLVELIRKELLRKNLGVTWQDCVGMEEVTQLLKEAVVLPLEFPKIFSSMSSWKSVLLFGPPGTGKTLSARALASESQTTFINLSPSTFISKWRGESEKLVRLLFEMAKHYAPTTIFIDEIDALASRRDEAQHEASRRFKSELLCQMEGLQHDNAQIFILATTNIPWNIDSAVLRRFDKKVLVDLPNELSRTKLFGKFLDVFDESFAGATEGFSGSDIRLVCKTARMIAFRRKIGQECKDTQEVEVRKEDVYLAIKKTKPVKVDRNKYLEWESCFGCT